jgi:hypothetical protein
MTDADHGMDNVRGDWINLDHFADLSNFHTEGMLRYPNSEAAAQKAYEKLKTQRGEFVVYRRHDVPKNLHSLRHSGTCWQPCSRHTQNQRRARIRPSADQNDARNFLCSRS